MAKKTIPEDRVIGLIEKDDLFINVEYLEYYRKNPRTYWDVTGYDGLVLGFGKNVFVFDIDSCDFKEKS